MLGNAEISCVTISIFIVFENELDAIYIYPVSYANDYHLTILTKLPFN